MAVHHVTVTLGATATAILTPSTGNPSVNCQELQLESETGNADVKVGSSTVSSTDYGRTIEAGPSKAVIIRGYEGRPINLASTYLFGTASQKVHCMYTV
jgi:hypothetical protein